jgi:hypothetical protein
MGELPRSRSTAMTNMAECSAAELIRRYFPAALKGARRQFFLNQTSAHTCRRTSSTARRLGTSIVSFVGTATAIHDLGDGRCHWLLSILQRDESCPTSQLCQHLEVALLALEFPILVHA